MNNEKAKKMVKKSKIQIDKAELVDPFFSEENINHLTRGLKALNNGKGIEHELIDEDADF